MQVGDTLQETYTPYQFLEYYNEGMHLLNALMGQYCPSLVTETFEDTGKGRIVLPSQCINVLKVTAEGEEVGGFHVLNLQTVVFDAEEEQTISVDYVKSVGYKQFDDDSELPAELESLLVDYMVYRIMNVDITGLRLTMIDALQTLNDGLNGDSRYTLAKGYYDYECKRIDYSH